MTRLLPLSLLLLLTTLFSSFLPLYLSLSPLRLKLLGLVGKGVLVGAALGVVVPEGVEGVYASSNEAHVGQGGWIGMALVAGFTTMYLIDTLSPHSHGPIPRTTPSLRTRATLHRAASVQSELEPLSSASTAFTSPSPSRSREGTPPTLHQSHPSMSTYDWEEPNSGKYLRFGSSPLVGSGSTAAMSTVIGLLAHSLADGLSLGASSISTTSSPSHDSSAHTSLDIIVFLAIILHKAPTAFALSTILLSSTSQSFTRRALLLFSFATPISALLTYSILSLLGVQGSDTTKWYTGIVLVFSGGTFLFVATGLMNEKEEESEEGLGWGKVKSCAIVLIGMFTPLLLSKLVGHGH